MLIAVWWLQRMLDGGCSQALWLWRRWYPLESTVALINVEIVRVAAASQLLHVVQFVLTGWVAVALHRRQTARLKMIQSQTPPADEGGSHVTLPTVEMVRRAEMTSLPA